MIKIDLTKLTLVKAAEALKRGDFNSQDLVAAYLQAIEEKNSALNIYLEVFTDEAKQQAEAADKRRERGESLGELDGLPIAIKDNMLIKGHLVSSGSQMLKPYSATYDATVIKKLREAGAIFLGRVNMDEFAMGSSNETSAYGPVKNPLDPTRVPGGSSGGSAAAVAANLALAALGSDTGGSIRQPASFCGLVGFKPSYGAVSRYGLMALSSSLDQIGPLTKTVEDTKLLFDVIKGQDPLDSTSTEAQNAKRKTQNFKIGVPWHFFEDKLEPEVLADFKQSLEKLKVAGHEVKDINLPNVKYSLPCYYVIQPAEASSNLARYDGLRYGYRQPGEKLLDDYLQTRGRGFGREVRRRIMLGTYVLSAGYYDAYYGQAKRVSKLISQELAQALETVDVIATPTTPSGAFKLGERLSDPIQMYLADIFTVPANIAGLPSVSIPAGKDKNQLPLGFQLTAGFGQEETILTLGQNYEHVISLS